MKFSILKYFYRARTSAHAKQEILSERGNKTSHFLYFFVRWIFARYFSLESECMFKNLCACFYLFIQYLKILCFYFNLIFWKQTSFDFNSGKTLCYVIKKIRKFLPSQFFLNNEKFVVQIKNFFWKWNLDYQQRIEQEIILFHSTFMSLEMTA